MLTLFYFSFATINAKFCLISPTDISQVKSLNSKFEFCHDLRHCIFYASVKFQSKRLRNGRITQFGNLQFGAFQESFDYF